jgi:two-component system sensor histidine kinase KdpD
MLLLRSVSHDMRSPLNVILAASTELRDGPAHDDVTRRRLLGLVVDESRRLDRIVDNMLNLSRLQAGALVPARQRVHVGDLLDESVERFRRVAHSDDRVEVPEPPDVEVDVDPVQVDQVLANLLENAVRHGGSPAHVVVQASVEGEFVRVAVEDDGVGFAESARAQLFSPFASTDNSSGLGLTVCKAIVEAHGGTMSVSDPPSGGTSVSFTVPRAD